MASTLIPLNGARKGRIDLSLAETDIAGNRTRWGWAAYFDNGGSSVFGSGNTFTLEGLVESGPTGFTITAGSGLTLLGSGSVWVPHNADGSHAPVGIRLRIASTNSYVGNGEGVAEEPAPTIPRATTAVMPNGGWFEPGTALTISLPRASTGFTHDVRWAFGTLANQTAGLAGSGNGAGASLTWTPPASMLSEMPNGAYGRGLLTVTTKNSGGAVIGTTYTEFWASASNRPPTVSAITAADGNSTVNSVVGAYVQGLSLLVPTVTADGQYGATITSRNVTVDGVTVPSGGQIPLDIAGTRPVSATVTDSRGQTGTGTGSVTVLAYAPPVHNAPPSVRRAVAAGTPADEGTYLRVDLNAAVTSLIVSAVQKNTITIRVFTRQSGTSTWIARNVISPAGVTYNSNFVISGGGIFDITKSYDVRIEVADKFGTVPQIVQVATSSIAVDINGNAGVGIAKYHTQGALDVGGEIYQNNKLVVDVALTATSTRAGILEIATAAEAASADASRALTGAILSAATAHVTAQRTATSQTSASSTPVQLTSVQAAVALAAAGDVRVELGFPAYSTDLADVIGVQLRDGATVVREWMKRANSGASIGTNNTQILIAILPAVAAGSHTYTVWFLRAAGSGTITVAPSPTQPAWISAHVIL